jgi:hypothetical protein
MAFLIVICVALPIIALAAQRNDFKRMGLIAVALEAAKYLLFFAITPIRNEFFNPLFTFIFYVTMLPELMIGSESGPNSVWQWIARLFAGIVWNLAPAYLICLILPERPATGSARSLS